MKCSKCGIEMLGFSKDNTSDTYPDGTKIICLQCHRSKYPPGTVIEVDYSRFENDKEFSDFQKFNGLKGIIVRPLGCHEDLAGCLDYVVSWDWTDDRLVDFLKMVKGTDNLRDLLDPRVMDTIISKCDKGT